MTRARCRGRFRRLITLLAEYGNDRVFPLLWDFPLAPDEGGKPAELQQDGPVLLKSEFQQLRGKVIRPHCFRVFIAFIAVAVSSSVGSIRALATVCYGSLFGMSGSSISDFAFISERKNRTHLSQIRPLSRSSLPSSSRTHCDSTFFVSPSCNDLMFWKNPCWFSLRSCHLNDVAFEETNDCGTLHSLRLLTCLSDGPPQLRNPCVHFQALSRCVHCISRSLQFSFRSGVSTPTRPGLLRSWGRITAVCMMAAANAASTSSTLLSPDGFALRCLPTAVAPSCRSWGSGTRRLRPTGGLVETFNRRFQGSRGA